MLVQFSQLELVVAHFLDISPVIKVLSWFKTKPEHISRTLNTKKTLVTLVVCYGRGTTLLKKKKDTYGLCVPCCILCCFLERALFHIENDLCTWQEV